MMSSIRDTTLTTALFAIAKTIVPFTAGTPMPPDTAAAIVTRLAKIMKLANLMEQELAIHRDDEAGLSIRAMMEREVNAAVGAAVNVVKVDFEKGKKP